MKLSCTQQNLQKGLSIVARAITNRGSLPILTNVLLATTKGRLKLVATDLEIAVITYIGAKIDQEGSLTVPAKLFSEFVVTNSDPTIILSTEGTTLHVKSDRFEANIKGIAAEEFPLIPEVKKEQTFSLPALQLKQAIEQVAFAAAADETRPILTGVYVHVKSDQLTLAATDSYRLAEKKIKLPKAASKEFSVVVPARTIHEVARIIDDTVDMVEVAIGENQIQFTLGASQITSRLLEGKFPDYRQIIPQTITTSAALSTHELSDAIKIASFFAREVANNIKLRIPNGNSLEVVAVSPQVGDTRSSLKTKTKGGPIEVAFNAKFLSDGLQAVRQETVSLELSGALSPGMLKPSTAKGSPDSHYLYIVMPLKLDE